MKKSIKAPNSKSLLVDFLFLLAIAVLLSYVLRLVPLPCDYIITYAYAKVKPFFKKSLKIFKIVKVVRFVQMFPFIMLL